MLQQPVDQSLKVLFFPFKKSHVLSLPVSHVDLEREIASDQKVTVNVELLSVPGFWETAKVWSLSYKIWRFMDLYSANYKTSA